MSIDHDHEFVYGYLDAERAREEPPDPPPTHVPVEPRCGCGRVLGPGGTCPYIVSALRHHTYAGQPAKPDEEE